MSATRTPRKTNVSATSSSGSAISSPMSRSVETCLFASRCIPRSPPTLTVAPGTLPFSTSRIASTRLSTVAESFDSIRFTSTSIRLARPSVDRSLGSAASYAVVTEVTPSTRDTRSLAASTAARTPGSVTAGPSTTAMTPSSVWVASSQRFSPLIDSALLLPLVSASRPKT